MDHPVDVKGDHVLARWRWQNVDVVQVFVGVGSFAHD